MLTGAFPEEHQQRIRMNNADVSCITSADAAVQGMAARMVHPPQPRRRQVAPRCTVSAGEKYLRYLNSEMRRDLKRESNQTPGRLGRG